MASTVLTPKTSPGSLILRYMKGKFDAVRYLPFISGGIIRFNRTGDLVADQDLTVVGTVRKSPVYTPVSISTAGAGTYTAANLLTSVILRDCAGAIRTDTTDTAANIISTLGLTADYQEIECLLVNKSAGAFAITLAGGTNVTLKDAITCEQNTAIRLSFLRTSATTVTVRQV